MTDIFEAPKKPGYGVGVSIIVVDDRGNQISTEHYEALGFDNATADVARRQIKDAVEELVEGWKSAKYGGPPQSPKRG